jgi:hypothetical protein
MESDRMKDIWKHIFLHTVLLGSTLALFYLFLLQPQHEILARMNRDVNVKVTEIEEGLSALEVIGGMRDEDMLLQGEVDVLEKKFVPRDSLEKIGLELAEWADRAGFEVIRIVPPIAMEEETVEIASESGVRIVEMPLTLEMRGDYLRYGKLMQSLDGFQFHIKPGKVSIVSEDPGRSRVDIKTVFKVYVVEKDSDHES